MKLIGEPFALKLLVNGVDAISDNQRGAFRALGQEIAHRSIQRPRHAHCFAIAREQCK
jgi:hypothetical protein